MTLKSLFRPLLLAITLLPLSACSSLFKPDHMTIEYDEEVKLHDGEMIWVHITRHYILSSAALGDPGGLESSYKPKEVEISWDTGFEGVGRKSVYIKALVTIDKFEDTWYIGGAKTNAAQINNRINNSVNCLTSGIVVQNNNCVVAINNNGYLEKSLYDDKVIKSLKRNILYPSSIKSWEYEDGLPPLNEKKIDWSRKISLQQDLRKNYLDIPLESNWLNQNQ